MARRESNGLSYAPSGLFVIFVCSLTVPLRFTVGYFPCPLRGPDAGSPIFMSRTRTEGTQPTPPLSVGALKLRAENVCPNDTCFRQTCLGDRAPATRIQLRG